MAFKLRLWSGEGDEIPIVLGLEGRDVTKGSKQHLLSEKLQKKRRGKDVA